MKKVELSNATVHLKDSLTWGDENKIERYESMSQDDGQERGSSQAQSMMDPATMKAVLDMVQENRLEVKYLTIECAVEKVEQNGEEVPLSREWIENLTKEDGEKLFEEADKVRKKK